MLRNVARSGKGHFVAHSHCEISFTRSMTSRNLLGKGRSLCAGPVRKLGATVDWVLRGTCGMSGGLGWASILECRCWRRISMRSSQSGGRGWQLHWWWSFTMSRSLENCSSARRCGSKCTISIAPLTCELHTYIVISRYLACSLQIQAMIFWFTSRCWICQHVSRRSLLCLSVPWRAFLANLLSSSGEVSSMVSSSHVQCSFPTPSWWPLESG